MQGLVATSQIAAGFALLMRVDENIMLFSENAYPIFRMLLEACRAVGDSDGACRVQAAMARLGLIAVASMATVLVQDSQ